MCNARSTTFTHLFLNLEEPEESDDDDSLSSASSVETAVANNNNNNNKLKSDDDNANASEENKSDGSDEQPPQGEDNSNEAGLPDVIEINMEDDNSVVEIDATSAAAAPPRPKKKKKRQSENNTNKNSDVSRIRRKAKRFKKQNKFLETQREEFVERERKLLEDFSNTRDRLEKLEKEQEVWEDKEKALRRDLEGYRVQNARLTRERDTANGELVAARARARNAVAELDEIKSRCRRDVENAQAQAMQEVRVMTDQQPKLIQENHELKELLVKKDQEVKRLSDERDALRSCVQTRAEKQVVSQRTSGTKQAKAIAKALRQAEDEREREEAQEARYRKQARAAASAASRPERQYSAQAARMSSVGLKVASKKSSVMDVLGSERRRKEGKSSGSAKGSHAKRHRSSDRDESIVLGGMSINVSTSNKRRKVETRPVGKAGTVKAKKAPTIKAKLAPRKEANMLDFFGKNSSAR